MARSLVRGTFVHGGPLFFQSPVVKIVWFRRGRSKANFWT